MSKQALDHFGRILMRDVRDQAITDWDMIIDGRMISPSSYRIRERLTGFDAQQIEVLRWLIPQIVDTTLHHLLWTLEQEESIDVAVKTPGEVTPSIREVSDGLAGELPTERGWIGRFSEERYVEP